MSSQDRPDSLHNAPLGQASDYPAHYDAGLLYPIARETSRAALDLDGKPLPFIGADEWTAFELSWLDRRGKPRVAIARFTLPATSRYLIESKSWKLYLNSFNQTAFDDAKAVHDTLVRDLTAAAGASVAVELFDVDDESLGTRRLPGECLDGLDIDIRDYTPNPTLLSAGKDTVEESLHSHLLKSNCPVTGQPDWGSVLIRYRGPRLDREGLLRYLVSYRQHQDFHEHCVERIFCDLMTQARPARLFVLARYVRRGGLDINPWRATPGEAPPASLRLARQ
ncbi:NADPH-dependent 7-cyano-7-deazaguanine reductase QueF [Aidingimonas halophila]|uniref:NADPH-dependent 7-cyano-7-deazaguanine reductase n=1 Tax=Aidingimonas halophila TaxID=574349 RepID=A0A1H3EP94_9GAMM|nr:NADPH-dependent 7-cyano-7-deazaguanine reductase QueF [Aidingimonas halophila]GHC31489.1 NADPH-dependent 7-cyano-7-deazaguanine reductase [Aidingimonas halophila]SDX80603.1 7-cyano-7-deazaguanine reductase [Aidingimonas halophila]